VVDVSYVPGPLTAVAGDQCWALVEASPDTPAVTRIWQQFGQGASADALLVSLLADGVASAPGFALLTAGTGGQRLFCRGAVGATVVSTRAGERESASERMDGAGLLTWREHVVAANVERIFLGEPPTDAALRLPATSGVLLAGCVIIDFTNLATRETVAYEPEKPREWPKRTIVFYPDTLTVPPPDGEAGQVPDPVAVGRAGPGGSMGGTAAAMDGGHLNDGSDNDGDYDFLWGATQMRSVEEAAIRGPEDGGLIDVPQWLAGPVESSTIKRGDLPGPRTIPPDRIGPVVPALICPNGHVNPPSGAACRQCGAPLPRDPVPVPRPVLGVLRLSLGDVITLDRGVVMGRSPRTDFPGTDGEERPHVVKLPSTDGEVSRTHLRVTLDGWHVLVTDLNSTNGTLVTPPGRDPQQLRPGEPVPIQPGTVVTLAVGIDFRYEVTH
jgi:hypothetical protein